MKKLIAGFIVVNLVTCNSPSQIVNPAAAEEEKLNLKNDAGQGALAGNDETLIPPAPSASPTKSIAEWSIYAYRLEQNNTILKQNNILLKQNNTLLKYQVTEVKENTKCMTFVRIVVIDVETKYILCSSKTGLDVLDPVYNEYYYDFVKNPEAYVKRILGLYGLAYDQENFRLVRIEDQNPNAKNWSPRKLEQLSKTEKWIFFLYAVKQCAKSQIKDPDLIFWKNLQTKFETKRKCNFICLAKVIALAKFHSDQLAPEYSSMPEVDEVVASHKAEFRKCIWNYQVGTGFQFKTTIFRRNVAEDDMTIIPQDPI